MCVDEVFRRVRIVRKHIPGVGVVQLLILKSTTWRGRVLIVVVVMACALPCEVTPTHVLALGALLQILINLLLYLCLVG